MIDWLIYLLIHWLIDWLIDWWVDCLYVLMLSANNDRDVKIVKRRRRAAVESVTIATQTTPGLHKWWWTSTVEHLAMDCVMHDTWTVYRTILKALNSQHSNLSIVQCFGSSLGKSVFSRDVTDSKSNRIQHFFLNTPPVLEIRSCQIINFCFGPPLPLWLYGRRKFESQCFNWRRSVVFSSLFWKQSSISIVHC